MVNPLLLVLTEARSEGATESTALLRCMMSLLGKADDSVAALAAGWDMALGEPTWEKLYRWARWIATEPSLAQVFGGMEHGHYAALKSLTPKQRWDVDRMVRADDMLTAQEQAEMFKAIWPEGLFRHPQRKDSREV